MEFIGRSRPLSAAGIAAATDALSVAPAGIWTILAVETKGCGFLPDRRPQILYERHIFHRLTGGRFDDGDISHSVPGGYGPDGVHQYDRLARAIALDRKAALESASWGLAQVMGENCRMVGFPDVETMVAAMMDSEDAQLRAMAAFVKCSRLTSALQTRNWAAFARGYNGKDFARNQYDTKLAAAFQRFTTGPLPDLGVRSAQLFLTFCGFDPGPVDGMLGSRTRLALQQFQMRSGMPVTGSLEPAVLERLDKMALA